MASENVGSVSTGQLPEDREWIVWALQLARRWVLRACGEPPDGCRLGIVWHDHDLGSWPSLAVSCDDGDDLPWDYVEACERAFEVFDEAIDWSALKEHLDGTEDDDGEEEDEDAECDGIEPIDGELDDGAGDPDEPDAAPESTELLPQSIVFAIEVSDDDGEPAGGVTVGVATHAMDGAYQETDSRGRCEWKVPSEGAGSVVVTVHVGERREGQFLVSTGDVLSF